MLVGTGTGWIPDPADPSDPSPETPAIQVQLAKVFGGNFKDLQLPTKINLQDDFPPVLDQGPTSSCTAAAIAGLIGYFQNRTRGDSAPASSMFLYKTTRNLLGTNRDSGAYLRTAMAALVLFGAPPDAFWPAGPQTLMCEPPAFLYALAASYRALQYYRYDPVGVDRLALLHRIKANLAAGLPAVFGFYLFDSIAAAARTGEIPAPGPSDKGIGGHAVVAVGCDDARVVGDPGGEPSTGALRIRNAWGTAWGDGGYGWLPYDYVLRELALDWWSVLNAEWVNPDNSIFRISNKPLDKSGENKK